MGKETEIVPIINDQFHYFRAQLNVTVTKLHCE